MNNSSSIVKERLKRRYLYEQLFKFAGLFAVLIACIFLFVFIGSIIVNGYKAFTIKEIKTKLYLNTDLVLAKDYQAIINNSIHIMFPELNQSEISKVSLLISDGAQYELKHYIQKNIISKDNIVNKLDIEYSKAISYKLPMSQLAIECLQEESSKCSKIQYKILKKLSDQKLIKNVFNTRFFVKGDSRDPEMAGMAGSIMGSILVILICMGIALPISICSAVYLEELAPKNKINYFIEISINNLAAVPSIVFGMLGLAIFLGILNMPRSSSFVGGITLSMMALPILIVVTRQAIKTVPSSIKQGAMALGASQIQILLHHTLPLAMPGIMTGTILTICRVIGETAPMIMIGMVAFMVDIPTGVFDPATVMPVQIYLWANSPEVAFKTKTAGAILVLLAILIFMNILSVFLRKKYEVKW
ncbi:Phosphate transport system permease protein pstA [Rickettsiales bacterium Ac37b]|nr:Phosphate transport system permease protein pstA [Rickettsiales bacterium Ac37b]